MPATTTTPRRAPKQARSRVLVGAILEAARGILEREGPESLTTNRVAERAGISIGSLYRYFPNKEAILAALCRGETEREIERLRASASWPIEELPLADGLAAIVDFQLERHRRLLALGREFYRSHHDDFSLAHRMDAEAVVGRVRALLERHAECVRVRDREQAAFLIARGLSSLVRRALEERPELLMEPGFRQELVDLAVCYATAERA